LVVYCQKVHCFPMPAHRRSIAFPCPPRAASHAAWIHPPGRTSYNVLPTVGNRPISRRTFW
jgi:hypothetical protein